MLVTTPWQTAPDHVAVLKYAGAVAGTHPCDFFGIHAAYRIGKDGTLKWVVPLACDHAGGVLSATIRNQNVYRCPRHGWAVDLDTDEPPKYENGLPKSQLHTEVFAPYEARVSVPSKTLVNWKEMYATQYKEADAPGVTWLNHACLLIEIAGERILTDPWLVGPAFHNGWWLKHPTPDALLALAATAEYVYISHEHPDHLSPQSLRECKLLGKKYIVPYFSHAPQPDRVAQRLLAAGVPADNILRMEVAPGKPTQFLMNDKGLWAGMLCSSNQNLDSGLFLAHGETGLLLASDAAQLNGMVLPRDITFLATAFAGGASAYPTCFPEIDDYAVGRIVAARGTAMREHVYNYVCATDPMYYMPYAGHFVEDPTTDPDVYYRNRKLHIQEAFHAAIKGGARPVAPFDDVAPIALSHKLKPLGKLETTHTVIAPPAGPARSAYRRALWKDDRLAWDPGVIARYFLSSGYKGDFLLYVTGVHEFNAEGLASLDTALCVDYKDGGHGFMNYKGAAVQFEEGTRPRMHLTVRYHEAMLNAIEGRPLDELFIGFNARIKERGGHQAAWFQSMCTNMKAVTRGESWI